MICFDTTFRIRGIHMKGIEMGAYSFDRAKALTKHRQSVGKIVRIGETLRPVRLPLLSQGLGSWS